MNLKTYEKIDIASQMLDTALSLFMEKKDYFSVLQIAGACDEILGKHLKLKGIETSLETQVTALHSIKKSLSGVDSPLKRIRDELLNKAKNSIKHMNNANERHIDMDPKFEAEEMLDRVIMNWWKLKGDSKPLIHKYFDFQSKQLSTNEDCSL